MIFVHVENGIFFGGGSLEIVSTVSLKMVKSYLALAHDVASPRLPIEPSLKLYSVFFRTFSVKFYIP